MNDESQLKDLHGRALRGDHDAAFEILQMFRRKIYIYSFVNGQFHDDYFQELNLRLLQCIKKFRFKSNYDVLNLLKKMSKTASSSKWITNKKFFQKNFS
ncbi:MAG: helix-turn-helix domain-containing protein [Bacillota bacterium]